MATLNSSLPSSQPPLLPPSSLPTNLSSRLAHPPDTKPLTAANTLLCDVKPITFKVSDDRTGPVKAWLHIPQNYQREKPGGRENTAAILLSGAGGGVVGPSSIWLGLADKAASLDKGIPVMRLDYRYPARNKYCVADVQTAMKYLETGYAVSRFILVGWSFGGAPVFTVGGSDERVVACAMVASQLAETSGIRKFAPRPLLLIHGTNDKTLRYSCSQELYEEYGEHGEKRLKLFDGDDHAMTKNAKRVEKLLCQFIMKLAGAEVKERDNKVMEKGMIGEGDRVELMKEGGDLRGAEKVE